MMAVKEERMVVLLSSHTVALVYMPAPDLEQSWRELLTCRYPPAIREPCPALVTELF